MIRTTSVGIPLGVLTCVLLAGSAWAQQASGIAGVVKDTSGAVMPGVTVEAASPALIEKVRTVVSDADGRYNITPLQPGTYGVTFTLPGFRTIRREGIALTSGFTATVNAELQVGALEETVTVTGASPLVDTQNVKQQSVVSADLLASLPSGAKSFMGIARMVPGMSGGTDSGGAAGLYAANAAQAATVHGKAGGKMAYDNMQVDNLAFGANLSYIMNPSTVEETVVEAGGISAESDVSGLRMNLIPKEGGNAFKFGADSTYTNQHLQSDNLSDIQRARGLTAAAKVLRLYDANVTGGGRIIKDRLWFFTATRFSGTKNQIPGIYLNATQGTPLYTPDLTQPAYRQEWLRSLGGRITWQATPKDKVSGFADVQDYEVRGQPGLNVAPEAQNSYSFWPRNGLYQGTWSSPRTNKLLLEGGASLAINGFVISPQNVTDIFGFAVKPTDVSITEASTGFIYNAKPYYYPTNRQDRIAQRFTASYVTGSHAWKTGVQLQEHVYDQDKQVNQSMQWTFLRGVPSSITEWAQPTLVQDREAEVGLFAQDTWALKRLTFNYGLRLDYFNGHTLAAHFPAATFVPARDYPAVSCVPCWTDLNPRVGVSYDLFGTGRTALKMSAGRYSGRTSTTVGVAASPVSTSVVNASRTWNDTSHNYVPDCNLQNPAANGECGAINNVYFGTNNALATIYDHDLLNGFDKRDYFWDYSAEVQQQLGLRVSVKAGYYRNWSSNFGDVSANSAGVGQNANVPTSSAALGASNNLAVTPGDYQSYCITGPVDARLPGGGGNQVCGLYDVAPGKFAQGQVEVQPASLYSNVNGGVGKRKVSDFFTASISTRFGAGIEFGGSLDTGRTVTDNCFVVDSPQQLLNCRVVTPFRGQTQLKLYGSYPLPGGVALSGVLQNVSGVEYEANYAVPNAQVVSSLGRNLAACGAQTVCTATVTVPLITPQTQFEPRRTVLDLRLSKLFSLGSRARLRANFDLYNLLNSSSTLSINSTFGATWLKALSLMDGRLVQVGGQLSF